MSDVLRTGVVCLAAATAALMDTPTANADGEVRRAPPRARPAPPPAPVQAQPAPQGNWTGGQGGGFGGGSQMNQSFVEPGSNLCPYGVGPSASGVSVDYSGCRETDFRFSGGPWGGTVGLFLGYRWQFGNTVFGVETDLAYKNLKKSASLDTARLVSSPDGSAFSDRFERFTGRHSQTWDGSLRARLGLLVTPAILAYATGGLAYGKVCGKFSYDAQIVGDTDATAYGAGSWCDVRTGYTVGGGLEALITPGWTARLEYRYTDLGSYTKNIPLRATPTAGAACGVDGFQCAGNARIDLDAAFHTVRLGLAYNFNTPF